jgi:hypothetical protein
MALTDNLISYWKLDEASGTRVDSHGSNDLTDNNTVLAGTGIINNGADFESANSEYLSIVDNASLSFTGDHSFSFWFKPESSGAVFALISKYSQVTGNRSYLLRYLTTPSLSMIINNTGSSNESYTTAVDLGTGAFKHIVWTWDASASQGQFYVEDVNIGSPTGAKTSIFDGNALFTISRRSDEAIEYADGVMDEVGIWNRVLTSDEVTELYNNGDGRTYPFAGGAIFRVRPTLLTLGIG